ncbi:MAG: phosphohistidine phosphatase SixA [Symploca sp. SIO2E9]|nr:phosphohistidine phosphatase SixA [Symploca sp. SIO2E9]
MQLYLIRHGIAVERESYAQDAERPLTNKGRQKTTQVAKQLSERGLYFNLILTSPLVRAKQTAAILQEANLGAKVQEFASLAPKGEIFDWLNWLESQRQINYRDKCLALVGHQPDLGNWAETLVWGKAQEKLMLKKAGVIGIEMPVTKTPIGQSELFLLVSPKWLL